MLTIQKIVQELGLQVYKGENLLDKKVSGAYAGDLLSDVMGKSKPGELWITMQTHRNILAVASLKELAAIVIVNGGKPDEDTLALAASEGLVLLGTKENAFTICGRIFQFFQEA
jgi:predicted transcriptional regulator